MTAVLDILESKRAKSYADLLNKDHDCADFDSRVERLEEELQDIYQTAIEESKKASSVREVFRMWDKVASISQFFIKKLRKMSENSQCGVSFDVVHSIYEAACEKREFHRC